MNEDILKQALIPEDLWEFCYIADGIIYTPLNDENGVMQKKGEAVYTDMLNHISEE